MSILRTVLHKLICICYSRDTISLSRSKRKKRLQISAGLSAIKENGGNVYEKTNQCMYVSSNAERD